MGVFSGGAGGARAPPEFGGSQKRQSLISAYQSLAITTNTPGFEKLNTALQFYIQLVFKAPLCITLTISDQKIVSGSLFLTKNFFLSRNSVVSEIFHLLPNSPN